MTIKAGAGSEASPASDKSTTDVTANSSTADVDKGSSPEAQASVDGKQTEQTPQEYSKELLKTVTEAAKSEDDSEAEDNTDTSGADDKAGKTAKTGATDKTTDKTGAGGKDAAAEGDDVKSDDPADYEDTPFGKHPRFKAILNQRKEFREKSEKLEREVQQIRPNAEQFGKIDQFAKDFGISPQEIAESFRVMALVKTDPAAARQALAEHLARLEDYTGHKLPADLQKEVDDGVITQERALELSIARGGKRHAEQRTRQAEDQAAREREQNQKREQGEAQRLAAVARQNAVREVETKLLNEDPDYKRLQPWVIRELRAQMASLPPEQRPQTPEQAVKLFNTALETVRRDMRNTMPRKPEVRPTANSSHGGATSSSAQTQPTTLLEAVKQAAQTR